MFVIFLRFTEQKSKAPAFMAAHNAWLAEGFAAGDFLLSGGLVPSLGGAILAQAASRTALEARLAADPFVIKGIVTAEIHEITPGRADPRLAFLAA